MFYKRLKNLWLVFACFSLPLFLLEIYKWRFRNFFLSRGDALECTIGLALSDLNGIPVKVFHAPWYSLTRLSSLILRFFPWQNSSIFADFLFASRVVNLFLIVLAALWMVILLSNFKLSKFASFVIGLCFISMPTIFNYSGSLTGFYQMGLFLLPVFLSACSYFYNRSSIRQLWLAWFVMGVLLVLNFSSVILLSFISLLLVIDCFLLKPEIQDSPYLREKQSFAFLFGAIAFVLLELLALSRLFHPQYVSFYRSVLFLNFIGISILIYFYLKKQKAAILLFSCLTMLFLGLIFGGGMYSVQWFRSFWRAMDAKGGARSYAYTFENIKFAISYSSWTWMVFAALIFSLLIFIVTVTKKNHFNIKWKSGVILGSLFLIFLMGSIYSTHDISAGANMVAEDIVLVMRYYLVWLCIPVGAIVVIKELVPQKRMINFGLMLIVLSGCLFSLFQMSWSMQSLAINIRSAQNLAKDWRDKNPAKKIFCSMPLLEECGSILALNSYSAVPASKQIANIFYFDKDNDLLNNVKSGERVLLISWTPLDFTKFGPGEVLLNLPRGKGDLQITELTIR